jgi:hypothetical protein
MSHNNRRSRTKLVQRAPNQIGLSGRVPSLATGPIAMAKTWPIKHYYPLRPRQNLD